MTTPNNQHPPRTSALLVELHDLLPDAGACLDRLGKLTDELSLRGAALSRRTVKTLAQLAAMAQETNNLIGELADDGDLNDAIDAACDMVQD